jgi:hypothetical protein
MRTLVSLRSCLSLLTLLLASAACSSTPTFHGPCPAGWSTNTTGFGAACTAPGSVVAAEEAKLPTGGAWGFARVTTTLGAAGPTRLTSNLLTNAAIHLAGPGGSDATIVDCSWTPNPVATGTTDDQGVFALAAPAGAYNLEACAEVDGEMKLVLASATVGPSPSEQDLDWSDAPE